MPARARLETWLAPSLLTIDLDATLLGSHSDKEGAAGNFQGGFGFHPKATLTTRCREDTWVVTTDSVRHRPRPAGRG